MPQRYIGKKHTYRINDSIYKEFEEWCSYKGLNVSEAIRQIVTKHYIEDILKELKGDELK